MGLLGVISHGFQWTYVGITLRKNWQEPTLRMNKNQRKMEITSGHYLLTLSITSDYLLTAAELLL